MQAAIDRLRPLSLVIESSGSRVMRYSQNVQRVLKVPTEAVALLATLWLRGPQTAAELRSASERLHRFADVSSVEGYLEELATRPTEQGGPLVMLMPRRPGSREPRWAHLLSGTPAEEAASPAAPAEANGSGELAELREEVRRLCRRCRHAERPSATLGCRARQRPGLIRPDHDWRKAPRFSRAPGFVPLSMVKERRLVGQTIVRNPEERLETLMASASLAGLSGVALLRDPP